jgi:hypothetical protein
MKLIVLLIYVVIFIFIISRNSCSLVGQIYFLTTLGRFLVRMGGIYKAVNELWLVAVG